MKNTKSSKIEMMGTDAIELVIVELDKSETYWKENDYQKMVDIDIYISLVSNMEIRKGKIITLYRLKMLTD